MDVSTTPNMSRQANTVGAKEPAATRQKLLDAAHEEIYESGFQAASLNRILRKAGVTKGALYHHFRNKRELGYAVVDEILGPFILEGWLGPIREAEDPVSAIQEMLLGINVTPATARLGCPLNNLAQEMAPLDEGFRQRVDGLFDAWRDGLVEALTRGQGAGIVRKDVNVRDVVVLLIATAEGAISLTKSSQDPTVFQSCAAQFADYLETIRSRPSN